MPTSSQKLAVLMAFLAAALSLWATGLQFARTGSIGMTPLIGGLVMLGFGIGGYRKLKNRS